MIAQAWTLTAASPGPDGRFWVGFAVFVVVAAAMTIAAWRKP